MMSSARDLSHSSLLKPLISISNVASLSSVKASLRLAAAVGALTLATEPGAPGVVMLGVLLVTGGALACEMATL